MATTTTMNASSTTSFDGDYSFVHVSAEGGWADSWGKPPKTRKRISREQILLLEDLFLRNSHPTREERQTIALRTGMELRSVTIWLQNKRQLIKKNAAKANSTGSPAPSLASRPSTPAASASHQSEGSSQTLTSPTPSETDIPSSSQPESRPTLERVASLSEYPTPSRPVTINDTQEAQPIWKHMPSSPLASPPRSSSTKLPNRAYNSGQVLHKVAGRPYPPITRTSSVDSAVTSVSSTSSRRKRDSERASYLKPGYTLEWACAQATKRQEDEALTGVMTEDGTVSRERIVSSHPSDLTCAHEEDSKPTEDEMQAALALCGLLQLCR